MRPRTLTVILIAAAAALAALPALATEGAEGGGGDIGAGAARTDLRTVSGTISAVDAAGRRVTIATADGPVVLEFDRNTSVYLEERLGTVRDLTPGARVRASFGAERLAYWIELRPDAVELSGG